MCLKDADGMTNSEDPDQTAPLLETAVQCIKVILVLMNLLIKAVHVFCYVLIV